MSIAQRFSLAGFIAIAASSANAADLAPAPCTYLTRFLNARRGAREVKRSGT